MNLNFSNHIWDWLEKPVLINQVYTKIISIRSLRPVIYILVTYYQTPPNMNGRSLTLFFFFAVTWRRETDKCQEELNMLYSENTLDVMKEVSYQ